MTSETREKIKSWAFGALVVYVIVSVILGGIGFMIDRQDYGNRYARMLMWPALPLGIAFMAYTFYSWLAAIYDIVFRKKDQGILTFGLCALSAMGLFMFSWIAIFAGAFMDFGFPRRNDLPVMIFLEWFSRGAFFDLVESYDLVTVELEPQRHKFLYDTVEFSFRTLWGAWAGFLFATLASKMLDLLWFFKARR
ncbi:MAG: hypothetical protein R3C13_02810 [Hyphomonas sp.]|uniref:hypothetical protein n=1 Tax=Hyphomonas sp. TaxID=87 RepID=UPI003528E0A1